MTQTLLIAWFCVSLPALLFFLACCAVAKRKRPLPGDRICNCEADGPDRVTINTLRIHGSDEVVRLRGPDGIPYRFRRAEGR